MRRLALLLVCLAASVTLAFDSYLTTLTSAGASVSYTATSKGQRLAIQCDAAAYVTVGAGSATATAANGELVEANAPPFDVQLAGAVDTVAEIPVSGSNNCKLFHVLP